MKTIEINDHESFAREFLEEYLSRGLAALGKRDIDILVMYLLEKHGETRDLSNQDVSIALQADVATVKRLRYQAKLRYPPADEKAVAKDFLRVLVKAEYEVEKGRLIFIIEDLYLRNVIQGRLKAAGATYDSSFNTELFKVRVGHLEPILIDYYGVRTTERFVEQMNDIVKDEDKVSFGEIKKGFIQGASKKFGSIFVEAMKPLLLSMFF